LSFTAASAFALKGGSAGAPEKNAVYAACCIGWNVNGNQNRTLYDVPAPKRLVIQSASLTCSTPSGYTITQAFVGGLLSGAPWTPIATCIPMQAQPMPLGYPETRCTAQASLTSYAGPGSPLRAQARGYIGACCAANVTGHLVSMP
jgi:hypothetical protein